MLVLPGLVAAEHVLVEHGLGVNDDGGVVRRYTRVQERYQVLQHYIDRMYISNSLQSIKDPDHMAGSGSTSGNVNPDPGSKQNRDKLA